MERMRGLHRARGGVWPLLIVALAAPLVPAWPVPALAAGNDEAMAAGLKKFDDGRNAFEAGQFEEALNAFKSSFELLPSPNTRLYIGRCYRALGKTASAFTSFRFAAREAQDRLSASGEKRYAATRDTASQEAADLEQKVPRLTVAVPSNVPAGFVLKVDDKDLPKAAWGVATETDPGDIVVEATGARLVPFKKTVNLKEGATERVDVPLTRVPTATVTVNLKTLPAGLSLTMDGQPVDVAAAGAPREIDVGEHVITATASGYLPFTWKKSLVNLETQAVEVSLSPDPRAGGRGPSGTPKWLFFTVAGAALVSAGVASGIAVHAENEQSQQTGMPVLDRDPNVKSSIQSQAIWTDVLFAGAGVLGAGAVVLAITTRWKSEASPGTQASFSPWIAPRGGGIGATGRF